VKNFTYKRYTDIMKFVCTLITPEEIAYALLLVHKCVGAWSVH